MNLKNLRSQRGFTTIELVIIFIIICVLSGLILATHNGIDQKQDNTERQQDIDTLRVGLESYYSQYNKYPTLAELNSSTWRAANVKVINHEALRDPNSTSYNLAAKPGKNVYAYDATSITGRTCNDTKIICAHYTLTATLAGGGTYAENSLE